jgi:hypothetical protein
MSVNEPIDAMKTRTAFVAVSSAKSAVATRSMAGVGSMWVAMVLVSSTHEVFRHRWQSLRLTLLTHHE